jgi:hypothetical protein
VFNIVNAAAWSAIGIVVAPLIVELAPLVFGIGSAIGGTAIIALRDARERNTTSSENARTSSGSAGEAGRGLRQALAVCADLWRRISDSYQKLNFSSRRSTSHTLGTHATTGIR